MNKEELEEQIKQGSCEYDYYIKLGHIYLDEGRYDDLLNLYKKLKERDLAGIEKALVLSDEGHALDLSNRIDESIRAYCESLNELEKYNDDSDSIHLKALNHYSLFTLYHTQDEKQKHAEEALKYFNRLITKYHSGKPLIEAYSYVAEIYLQTEKFAKALSAYIKALELTNDKQMMIPILNGIAVIHGKMKNYDKSKKYFAEVLDKAKYANVPLSKIYFDMGTSAFENEHFQEALEYYSKALSLRQNTSFLKDNLMYEIDIHWRIGTIAYELEDGELLNAHLSKLLSMIDEEHSYYANTLLLMGHYYLSIDDFEKAREYYFRVISLKSSDEEEIRMAKKCLKRLPMNS